MKLLNQSIKILLVFGVIQSFAATKPYKTDFVGEWKLNVTKSSFGELPQQRAAAVSIKILQSKESITFERKFQNVPVSSKETLTFDGKDLEVKKEEYTALRSLTISEDKAVLTVNSKYHMTPEDQDTWDYTRVETYALAKDGKSMLLTRISTLPDGKQEIVKAFYNKVK